MSRFLSAVASSFALLLSATTVFGQNYTGSYVATSPQGQIYLALEAAEGGGLAGELSIAEYQYEVHATLLPTGITGSVSGADGTMGFTAQLQARLLYFQLYEVNTYGQPDYSTVQTIAFSPTSRSAANKSAGEADSEVGGVYINGTRLSSEKVASLEQRYNTTIASGKFWYDSRSGAWGVEGGPTVGFIPPGIDVPGPMPADISGTGTGIFINGREVHAQDQLALHQILGVTYPGRYWLDAQGNLGLEGGLVLVNLAQASQKAAGSKPGLTSGMGGTVGVDGGGGVLFYTPSGSSYKSWSN